MTGLNQWEYYLESFGSFWSRPKDEELAAILNELGEEGWEVFAFYQAPSSNKVTIVAKRPLSQAARRRRDWP